MEKKYRRDFLYVVPAIVFIFSCNPAGTKTAGSSVNKSLNNSKNEHFLALKSTVLLPDVSGGFDLMSLDIQGRLFVSAEDNHSLEIVDLKNQTTYKSIPNLNEPKWSFYHPEKNRIYVATDGDGKVTELDATTFEIIKEFKFKEACNNLRYDPETRQLYVGVGKSFGALGVIDLNTDKVINEIKLSGYLKQFELDGKRIYANIPGKNQVDVIDIKANSVVETWPLKKSEENVPMTLDPINHRLFIGCEQGKLIVLSTQTGLPVADLIISKGADGIYLDKKRSLIYVSCGEGYINVIKQINANHYQAVEKIKTVKGAATSFYSPLLDELFLAVSQSVNQSAAVRIYQPANQL